MGIPQYSSQLPKNINNNVGSIGSLNNYFTYEREYQDPEKAFTFPSAGTPLPNDFSSFPLEEQQTSSFITDYLTNGFTPVFVEKYNRELTVVASSLCVLVLITIGVCIWCLLSLFKQSESDNECAKENSRDATDELDSSCGGGSDLSVEIGKKWIGTGTIPKKKMPIMSKIFSKQNGNGTRILAAHRNIITPDKNIPFIVPTIQLPAQPSESCCSEDGFVLCDPHHQHRPSSSEPQPSTSTTRSFMSKQNLLEAQQFFPQLENPESDTCPLVAFTLFYELSTQILNVRLLEGRNFPDSVNHTVSVKVYPGRSAKQTTKEFRARSPVYNVEFCYHVRKPSLQTKILKLRAVIPGNPKRIIGYVNIALKDLPGFDSITDEITEDLKSAQLWRRVELPSEIGDGVKLQVSLKWTPEPSPGLLTLRVIEAAGLHENRDCDYSSSYVKVTLQEQGRNIKTRKTQLVRWGSVPVFDDVFVLTIPRELLTQISFLLVVIARGRLGSKAVLGKIAIGPVPYSMLSSTGGVVGLDGGGVALRSSSSSSSHSQPTSSSGTEIWEDMCHQPDTEIVRWLHLLP